MPKKAHSEEQIVAVLRSEWDSNSRYRFCDAHKHPCFNDLLRLNRGNEPTRETD